MTEPPTLRGRAQARRVASRRAWLFILLILVPIGLRALEDDASRLVRLASRGTIFDATAHTIFEIEHVLHCLGYLLAGLAIDRLGLKRSFGLFILAWAASTTIGATIADPVAYRVLSPLLTTMATSFALTSVLVTVRLAWSAWRRGVAIALLLWIFRSASHGEMGLRLVLRHAPGGDEFWRASMLVLVTLASALFAVWMLGFEAFDRDSGLDVRPARSSPDAWGTILADPGVWIIVGLQFCKALVWFDSLGLQWGFASGGNASSLDTLAVIVATPAAFLGAAWLSDHLYTTRRDWLAARRPPIVAGFAATAIPPLLGLLSRQIGPALQILDLGALGLLQVLDLLVLDCAPRPFVGRYIGVVLAGEAAASFYLRPLFESLAAWPHGIAVLVVVVSAAGAGLAAWLLPRLRPQAG